MKAKVTQRLIVTAICPLARPINIVMDFERSFDTILYHRITVEHWKDRNVRGGYYSWIKAVHLQLYNVGYNISLLQDHVVLVNGVAMKQYHNTHIVSVARILDQVVSVALF